MPETEYFLFRLTLVTVLTIMVAATIFSAIPPDQQHYYRGSVTKLQLLQNTPPPRIILVGGSNLAWGIDSELMEEHFGVPVINDGLDFHLGIIPLLEVREYLREGDIVIISLEYYNFTSTTDFFGIRQYLADWIEFAPERIQYLRNPLTDSLPMYNVILQRKINRQANILFYGDDLSEFRGIYTSQFFNEHGDFVGHLQDDTSPGMNADYGGFPLNHPDEAYIFLEEFNQYALSLGATVFYEATASRQSNCELTGMRYLRKFYNTLRTRTTISLLTNINQVCLPDEYFYDTPYHLNNRGRRFRTEQLITNLQSALDEMR